MGVNAGWLFSQKRRNRNFQKRRLNISILPWRLGVLAAGCGGIVHDQGDEWKRNEDGKDCRRTWNQYVYGKEIPQGKKPREYSTKNRVSKLEEYKPCIRDRIERYDLSAVRILEEIRKEGYPGSYTILKDYGIEVSEEGSLKQIYQTAVQDAMNQMIRSQDSVGSVEWFWLRHLLIKNWRMRLTYNRR